MTNTSYKKMQSYFKSLCNTYYIAYEQYVRSLKEYDIAKGPEKNEIGEECNYWHGRFRHDAAEIRECIEEMVERNISIIVTSKKEVFALSKFYAQDYSYEYDIINTDSEAIVSFPMDDELCREFLNAYKNYKKSIEKYDNTEECEVLENYHIREAFMNINLQWQERWK